MIYTVLNEIQVPALGLGTWQSTGKECREGVADALRIGYRHIDTAQSYDNEEEVGRGLKDSGIAREEIFLTTKVWMSNVEPRKVLSSTGESLRRLGVDYVDLLLIHWPVPDVPIEQTLDAMMSLQEEKKTRLIGVSNFPPSLYRRALSHAPVVCNQVEYHPFLSQATLLELARAHRNMITAYSPIAHGRVARDPVLKEIGGAHGKTAVQVALRWLLQQPGVAAIPKASSAEHRQANFDIFDFELSRDEMERISGLARGERTINPSWAPRWDE